MSPNLRILIVGGYGIFGGRLVELLEDDARLTLLVAGRSLETARRYCKTRSKASAQLIPTAFDRTTSDTSHLASLNLSLVVDASGPFQAYGRDGYRLIEQCIACKVDYLDLADGCDFVAGVSKFEAAAQAAGIFVLSGVSSFPVLTAAVVRRLSAGLRTVRSIRGGIAPSPYAGVGLNVIRAIAGYSGQKVWLKRGGQLTIGHPFTESMWFVIAVPGRMPLKRTRFSLVDVPDLRALVDLWPAATDVWMGAGPVPAALHWALTVFAWLVRLHLLPSLSWMAAAMHFVTNHIRWGEHRGGMFVEVLGEGLDGQPVAREWHLLAEGDDGPLIPSMAAAAVIRNILTGDSPPPGARTTLADVDLDDYERQFARRTIYTGFRDRLPDPTGCLYERVLGQAWQELPSAIRQLHTVTSEANFTGVCTVERGENLLARLIATLVGFPNAGAEQKINVQLIAQGRGERWIRTCGEQAFSSVQTAGRDGSEWLVRERFGPVSVDMALVVAGESLRYFVRRWAILGIPMPFFMAPSSSASESVEEGRFRFDVSISHRWTGLIVHYRGLLMRSSEEDDRRLDETPLPAPSATFRSLPCSVG